ncbi:MAG TPA: hypothetical protein V6D25_25495 [Leptolyngbyaceae cyanobacterium]
MYILEDFPHLTHPTVSLIMTDNHLIELAIVGNAQIIANNIIKDFQNAELLFPNLLIARPEEIIRS